MPWYYDVAEHDHELQNPTSAAKIRQLGERLRLGTGQPRRRPRVREGRPGADPRGVVGCRIVGVERAPEFVAAARERVEAAGLADRVEIVEGDAAAFAARAGARGTPRSASARASSGTGSTARSRRWRRRCGPAGHVVVGEPFWRTWPLPEGIDDLGYLPLRETVARFEAAGLALVSLIASSQDDWDTYESLHWRALEEWLAENPDDRDGPKIPRPARGVPRRVSPP